MNLIEKIKDSRILKKTESFDNIQDKIIYLLSERDISWVLKIFPAELMLLLDIPKVNLELAIYYNKVLIPHKKYFYERRINLCDVYKKYGSSVFENGHESRVLLDLAEEGLSFYLSDDIPTLLNHSDYILMVKELYGVVKDKKSFRKNVIQYLVQHEHNIKDEILIDFSLFFKIDPSLFEILPEYLIKFICNKKYSREHRKVIWSILTEKRPDMLYPNKYDIVTELLSVKDFDMIRYLLEIKFIDPNEYFNYILK